MSQVVIENSEYCFWDIRRLPLSIPEFIHQRDELRGWFTVANRRLKLNLPCRLHGRIGQTMRQGLDRKYIFDRSVRGQYQPHSDITVELRGSRLIRVISS